MTQQQETSGEETKGWWFEIRFRLAVFVADVYQYTGRFVILEPLMGVLDRVCRWLDPTEFTDEHINPAMVAGILKVAGISPERFNEMYEEAKASGELDDDDDLW
jgi:hypothetical protein